MSGLTPYQFLTVLDAAIASPAPRRGLRAPGVLSLRVPSLWGQRGRRDSVDEEGVPVWSYTRKQCIKMRAQIADAAKADASTLTTQATGAPHDRDPDEPLLDAEPRE